MKQKNIEKIKDLELQIEKLQDELSSKPKRGYYDYNKVPVIEGTKFTTNAILNAPTATEQIKKFYDEGCQAIHELIDAKKKRSQQ